MRATRAFAAVGLAGLFLAPSAIADPGNDTGNGMIHIQTAGDGTFNLGVTTPSAGSYGIMYDYPGSPGTSKTLVEVDDETTFLADADVTLLPSKPVAVPWRRSTASLSCRR